MTPSANICFRAPRKLQRRLRAHLDATGVKLQKFGTLAIEEKLAAAQNGKKPR